MRVEKDDITFIGRIQFRGLPIEKAAILPVDTTPYIADLTFALCCGSVITITDMIGGSDCQSLRLLGDGTTTIKNNTKIATNIGIDKLLVKDVVYTFNYINSLRKWFESA